MYDNLIFQDKDKKIVAGIKNNKISKIDIPEGVIGIASNAFKNSNIKEVSFPDSLEYIDCYAFSNCKLEDVYIKNKTKLDVYAFFGCSSLKSIYINSETIPQYCFENFYSKYMNITLKNTKEIMCHAFALTRIENINWPDSLKMIDKYAFVNAKFENTKLFLPEGLEEIKNCAFSETNLTDIYLPKSIVNIDTTLLSDNFIVHMYEETYKKFTKFFDVISGFVDLERIQIIEEPTLDTLISSGKSFKEINNIFQCKNR